MALLDDIVDGASSDMPVTTLLRKLRVLASRTAAAKLGDWVTRELDGYEDTADLPPYRAPFSVPVLGDFFGLAGSEVRNFPIPPTTFPTDMRDSSLFKLWLGVGLARVEEMARDDSVNFGWHADAIVYYNLAVRRGDVKRIVRDDMMLGTVARPVPRHIFVGIVDAVRNRVLDLALEIERVAPGAGERGASITENTVAAGVVNNFAFYAAANVAIDSAQVTQTLQLPGRGDEDGLVRYLGTLGMSPPTLSELRQALDADRRENDGAQGPRVTAWIGRATTTVGDWCRYQCRSRSPEVLLWGLTTRGHASMLRQLLASVAP